MAFPYLTYRLICTIEMAVSLVALPFTRTETVQVKSKIFTRLDVDCQIKRTCAYWNEKMRDTSWLMFQLLSIK